MDAFELYDQLKEGKYPPCPQCDTLRFYPLYYGYKTYKPRNDLFSCHDRCILKW